MLAMSEELRMSKQATIQAAIDVVQQPSGMASVGSGVLAVTTTFAEGITPFIPVLSLIAMIVFGIINVVTNRRRLKLEIKQNGDK
jgi:hypothetical protein